MTSGVIGGKTWAYLPMGYGAPFVNVGLTIYLYGRDYGTEPWVFLGWENDTKWTFFYQMGPTVIVSTEY